MNARKRDPSPCIAAATAWCCYRPSLFCWTQVPRAISPPTNDKFEFTRVLPRSSICSAMHNVGAAFFPCSLGLAKSGGCSSELAVSVASSARLACAAAARASFSARRGAGPGSRRASATWIDRSYWVISAISYTFIGIGRIFPAFNVATRRSQSCPRCCFVAGRTVRFEAETLMHNTFSLSAWILRRSDRAIDIVERAIDLIRRAHLRAP